MVDSPKKVSQFAGAAALFQKKDSDLKIKEEEEAKKRQQEAANKAEKREKGQFSGAGSIFQQRAGASVGNLNVTMSPLGTSKRSSLKLPSFVSPGPGAAKSEAEKGWKSQSSEPSPLPFGSSPGGNYPTSSYLKKPSGTPAPPQKDKRPTFSTNNYPTTSYLNKGADLTPTRTKPSFAAGFNGLPFTPSPSSDKPKLPKVTSQSWKDKGISFQATSPAQEEAVKKPSVAPTYYDDLWWQSIKEVRTPKLPNPFADTKIEAKIPTGIDK
jgi:hypothetical protein